MRPVMRPFVLALVCALSLGLSGSMRATGAGAITVNGQAVDQVPPGCTAPADFAGTWFGRFSGAVNSSWRDVRPSDDPPLQPPFLDYAYTRWTGSMGVNGWISVVVTASGTAAIGVRMNFIARGHGTDVPTGATRSVDAFGQLRGYDAAFDPAQMLSGAPVLWQGGQWGEREEGGSLSWDRSFVGGDYTPPSAGRPVLFFDGTMSPEPAAPLALVVTDSACDRLTGTVRVPFWAFAWGLHNHVEEVAAASPLPIVLLRARP